MWGVYTSGCVDIIPQESFDVEKPYGSHLSDFVSCTSTAEKHVGALFQYVNKFRVSFRLYVRVNYGPQLGEFFLAEFKHSVHLEISKYCFGHHAEKEQASKLKHVAHDTYLTVFEGGLRSSSASQSNHIPMFLNYTGKWRVYIRGYKSHRKL